jgi:hypothetical protein
LSQNAIIEEGKYDDGDVSMTSEHSVRQPYITKLVDDTAPEMLGSLIDTGNKYYQKLFCNTQRQRESVFMQLMRHLSYIFDPWREESIPRICLKSEKVWHRIPLD